LVLPHPVPHPAAPSQVRESSFARLGTIDEDEKDPFGMDTSGFSEKELLAQTLLRIESELRQQTAAILRIADS
jgi:hypothetical protein